MKPLPSLDLLAPAPAAAPWAAGVLLGLGLLVMALALGWPHTSPPPPSPAPQAAALAVAPVRHVRLPPTSTTPDWADLFALLQRHGRGAVALLELTPQARPGNIELVGQTASLQSMVEWLQALEADPQLSEVTLTSHAARVTAQGESGSGTAYRFVVQARWHADGDPVPAPRQQPPRPQGENAAAAPG